MDDLEHLRDCERRLNQIWVKVAEEIHPKLRQVEDAVARRGALLAEIYALASFGAELEPDKDG